MELQLLDQELAVIHFSPKTAIPSWVFDSSFFSITKTQDELSIFCDSDAIPPEFDKSGGWRAFRIVGQIEFELAGMISSLSLPLSSKQISIFSISTYDTDYMIVQNERLTDATIALEQAGHYFVWYRHLGVSAKPSLFLFNSAQSFPFESEPREENGRRQHH